MAWRPVLDGEDARRARVAVTKLADDLSRRQLDDPSLQSGCAGVALIHAELAREGDERAAERAHDALARSISQLDAVASPVPWLGNGLSGLGWVLEQLRDVAEIDTAVLEQLDEVVAELVSDDTWPHYYWLWRGLVGLGVYALERRRFDTVARVVAHLDRLATRTPGGIAWWNREEAERPGDSVDPRGYHNLGMALGVAGATAFLAEAHAVGVSSAGELLGAAVPFLLSHERADSVPRFPNYDGLNVPIARVRNSWCYGDAAIAAVVVRAGQVAHVPAWVERGRTIAHAMARGPVDDVPQVDATLCCGTAGRAHLFNRLAQALDDPSLSRTARRYHLETLDRIEQEPPVLPHFNVGATGIALTLHAAISPSEPRWDRALLIALPPAR